MSKIFIAILVILIVGVLVVILFPIPQSIDIQTNVSCDNSPSLDIKNNLEKGIEQAEICEEKCIGINIDSSSSSCRDGLLVCICQP